MALLVTASSLTSLLTFLGPCPVAKCVYDDMGLAVVTSDPVVVLDALRQMGHDVHDDLTTVACLLLDACKGIEADIGSGVTTMVSLTVLLSGSVLGLLSSGVPITPIWRNIRTASRICEDVIQSCRMSLEDLVDATVWPATLRHLASSLLHKDDVSSVSALVASASSASRPGEPLPRSPRIRYRLSLDPARVINGVCIDVMSTEVSELRSGFYNRRKKFVDGSGAPNSFPCQRLALINGNIHALSDSSSAGVPILAPQTVIHTGPQWLAHAHAASSDVDDIMAHLMSLDVQLILATGSVAEAVVVKCSQLGIVILGGVRLLDIQSLSSLAGVPVCKDVASLTPSIVTAATAVTVELLSPPCFPESISTDDGALIEFARNSVTPADGSGASKAVVTTTASLCVHVDRVAPATTKDTPSIVILCAPCVTTLRRREFLFLRCWSRLRSALSDKCVLPGSGTVVVMMINRLRQEACSASCPFAPAVFIAVADALEALLSSTLANTGLRVEDVCARLSEAFLSPISLPRNIVPSDITATVAPYSPMVMRDEEKEAASPVYDCVAAVSTALQQAFSNCEVLLRANTPPKGKP